MKKVNNFITMLFVVINILVGMSYANFIIASTEATQEETKPETTKVSTYAPGREKAARHFEVGVYDTYDMGVTDEGHTFKMVVEDDGYYFYTYKTGDLPDSDKCLIYWQALDRDN